MRERRTHGSVRGLRREPLVYSTAESRRAEEARADGIAGSLAAGRREAEDAEPETKASAADDRFIEIDNYDLPF